MAFKFYTRDQILQRLLAGEPLRLVPHSVSKIGGVNSGRTMWIGREQLEMDWPQMGVINALVKDKWLKEVEHRDGVRNYEVLRLY